MLYFCFFSQFHSKNQNKTNQNKKNQNKSNQFNSIQFNSIQFNSKQIKTKKIKTNQINSKQIKSNQFNSIQNNFKQLIRFKQIHFKTAAFQIRYFNSKPLITPFLYFYSLIYFWVTGLLIPIFNDIYEIYKNAKNDKVSASLYTDDSCRNCFGFFTMFNATDVAGFNV